MELKTPLFSIIIPVYNAIETLNTAIESILSQTYNDWELILIDDCSTDGSDKVEKQYARIYPQIKSINLSQNSGNAKKPRDIGVKMAIGEYIICVDSDDEIAANYLEIMHHLIISENADIVLPMVSFSEAGKLQLNSVIPSKAIMSKGIISGKDACLLTLLKWEICCGGMAFRREYYDVVYNQNPYYFMNSDEYTSRLILLQAERVVFSDALYVYWQYPTSITHKISTKIFDTVAVDLQLIDLVSKNFRGDIVYQICNKTYRNLWGLHKRFFRFSYMLTVAEKQNIRRKLMEYFYLLRQKYEYLSVPSRPRLLKSYALFYFLSKMAYLYRLL